MDLENIETFKKINLAENPSTPVDVLRELAKEVSGRIREHVAQNPNTPIDALRDLAKDEFFWVREYVAKNPNASSKLLVMLFEYEKNLRKPDDDVIRALYFHKNLPAFAKRVIETLFGEMVL